MFNVLFTFDTTAVTSDRNALTTKSTAYSSLLTCEPV